MANTISSLKFSGTKEQQAQLEKVIAEHRNEKGALMPIMQKAQDIHRQRILENILQNICRQKGRRGSFHNIQAVFFKLARM